MSTHTATLVGKIRLYPPQKNPNKIKYSTVDRSPLMMTHLFLSLHLPPLSLQHLSHSLSPSSSPSLCPPTLHLPSPTKTLNLSPSPKPRRRPFVPLAINLTASGNPEDSSKNLDIDRFLDRARHLFDRLPQPVKSFPWGKTLENFTRLLLDLTLAVLKYLSLPVLAVSQLSEMSYCAHERKMGLIPFPFLFGFAVAGVLKDTAVELSPDLKEEAFPWHLLMIALFFALLKLPGPYYPYWGRLLVPHFANGGLWRSVWLAFMWYRGRQSLSHADSDLAGELDPVEEEAYFQSQLAQ